MTKLNAKQQRTLDNATQCATLHGFYEVKDLRINNNEHNADVYIQIEVGRPNDEGTLSECLCRDCYGFWIGSRGGMYFYNENRGYNREYISCTEVYRTEI